MRRAAGVVAVVAAMGLGAVAALGALGSGLGCGHDAKPAVQPDDHPPLPPASGTPIGYLVDDATELKLTDDQLGKLKTIDDSLAAKLATLDGELRSANPVPASSGQSTGRRGGGRRGGMGGGRRGGMGGGGGGSGSGSAAPRRQSANSVDTANRVTEERAADVRDAIDHAMAELDMVQRIVAKRVLADHGVDLDAGRTGSAGAAAGSARPRTREPEPDSDSEPDDPDSGDGSGSN